MTTSGDTRGSAASPRRPGGGGGGGGSVKTQTVKVVLLDDTVNSFQVPCRVPGQELFNAVVKKLRLLEIDYFDLEFLSREGRQCWLDHSKTLPKQCPSSIELVFYFSVKFYPPDPHLLEDEFTRFLFSLQIKRDLINGLLPCSENTTALLASYLVQAEIGDFLEDEYLDALYLTQVKVLPEPVSDELLRKVMEYHRAHFGLSPEDAEYSLLDTVRKVELYGVRLHAARDHDGLPLNLAVAHPGVLVFQGAVRVNTFSWAKVRKLSFKRKKFLVKLHPDTYGYYKDTVDFYFDSRDECKQFWKKCIEHHTFFRCQSARAPSKHRNIVVSKGSSFRYSGRTQKQLVEFVRENYVKRPYFDRSANRSLPSRSPASRRSGPPSGHHHSAGGGGARSGASTTSHGSHVLLPSNGDATRPLLDMAAGHLRRPASVSPPQTNSPPQPIASGRRGFQPVGSNGGGASRARSLPGDDRVDAGRFGGVVAVTDDFDGSPPPPPPPPPLLDDEELPIVEGVDGPDLPPPSLAPSMQLNEFLPLPPPPPPPLLDPNEASSPGFASLVRPTPQRRPLIRSDKLDDATATAGHSRGAATILGHREETDIIQEQPDPLHLGPRSFIGRHQQMTDAADSASVVTDLQHDDDGARSVASHTLGGLSSYAASAAATTDDADSDARSIASATSGALSGSSRRRRHQPKERAYFAAKMLLACERQVNRDLRLLCHGLPGEMDNGDCDGDGEGEHEVDAKIKDKDSSLKELLAMLEPVRSAQQRFLSALEQRLRAWEAASAAVAAALANGQAPPPTADDQRRLGDLLLEHLPLFLPPVCAYAQALPNRFLSAVGDGPGATVRRFESSRACHLPLACLLLGPARRPARLAGLCERLLAAPAGSADTADCRAALRQLVDAADAVRPACDRAEQLCGLVELRRDLPAGLEGVLDKLSKNDESDFSDAAAHVGGVRLVRIGWLRKPGSRRGGGGRLLCLLSDRLLILGRPSTGASLFSASASAASASVASAAASATSTPTGSRGGGGCGGSSNSALLRLRAKIPLRGLRAFETPTGVGNSDRHCQLSLIPGATPSDAAVVCQQQQQQPVIVLAARSRRQRDLWLRDLQTAAADAPPMSTTSPASATPALVDFTSASEQLQQQRALLPTRVCWHRCASVGFSDIERSHSCDLSGHLLRKLTSAPGWQRLWVAFSHLALFFYKSYRDEAPMATLPLIGYRVGPPDPSDQELVQGKSHVFKLQWKHHRYFFRADSEYTYNSWLETLSDAILPLAAEPEAERAPLRE